MVQSQKAENKERKKMTAQNWVNRMQMAGVPQEKINKMINRGNIGIAYWYEGSYTCFCMSDKGRKCRYINANTRDIGYIEGFKCDSCRTYFPVYSQGA